MSRFLALCMCKGPGPRDSIAGYEGIFSARARFKTCPATGAAGKFNFITATPAPSHVTMLGRGCAIIMIPDVRDPTVSEG